MPLTITRAQRDAIYEVVVTHLTGIGDVWHSVDRREFATAKRLGRAFAEDLRLLEDLGWAESKSPSGGDLAGLERHVVAERFELSDEAFG